MVGAIPTRDCVRFFIALGCLLLVHEVLFDVSEEDVTQFCILAAAYAILAALRERTKEAE